MKRIPGRFFRSPVLLALLSTLNASFLNLRAASIVWTNTAGGNWSDAANWSPNQVPGELNALNSTDDVLITNAGTYTVVLDEGSSPGDYWDIRSLTLGAGNGNGIQMLAMTNKILYVDPMTINAGGELADNGSSFHAAITVADGGQLNSVNGTYFVNPLTIASGGEMTANGYYAYVTFHGNTVVDGGGSLTVPGDAKVAQDGAMTILGGGLVNIPNGRLFLYGPMTNSGTVNLTGGNSTTDIELDNNGTANEAGFLLNQPGGVINLNGNSSVIQTGTGPDDYFINQGVLANTGSHTVRVSVFDTSAGTVTNLSGTLSLGTFTNTLAGVFYATNGATIKFSGGTATTPLTPGSPLMLTGGGSFQFTSGWLDLPADVIPNLQMVGGMLALEPTFQGGVITNLALNGITMSNAGPWSVTGTFNTGGSSTIYGDLTVENGAALNGNATLQGNLTVASGGELGVNGDMTIEAGRSLTVGNGGVVNVNGRLFLYGPMSNSGTVNVTSGSSTASQILLYNNGTSGDQGSLLNLAGGIVNLNGPQPSTITSQTTPDDAYFFNQGTLISSGSSGRTISVADFDTSAGVVTNLSVTLSLSTFTNTLTGTFYSTNGTTIKVSGGTVTMPLTPGTPLALQGGGNFQFTSGWLDLPEDVISNLDLRGGYLELEPTFQGGVITNLALDGITLTNLSLPVSNGIFAVTNSTVYGDVAVENGGHLIAVGNYGTVTFPSNVMVEAGGLLTMPSGNADITSSGSLTVDVSGTMNISGGTLLQLHGPLTNSGTINLLGDNGGVSQVALYEGSSYNYRGGIWNLPGGTINLNSVANGYSTIGTSYGSSTFVNQGVIFSTTATPSGHTINVGNFDNSAGVITNLNSTMDLSTFVNTLAGTFYTTNGTTIRFEGGTASNPLKPGSPLALLGGGQFQFYAGWLDLPDDIIPNVDLRGGYLELEPTFQGGVITNLALDGITLTNVPGVVWAVTNGTLAVTNSTVYGDLAVQNGGQLIATASGHTPTFHDPLTVTSGGSLTVASGASEIASDSSLTVGADGTVNIIGGAELFLYGPLTNSGTINLAGNNGSVSEVLIYTGSSYDYQGGIWNSPDGTINFDGIANGYSVIQTGYGSPTLLNQGAIVANPGSPACSINVPGFTNSGTITALTGTLNLNTVSLQPSGTLSSRLNSASDCGKLAIKGNAVFTGTFGVWFNTGYVPTPGTSFTPLSYGSYSGNFTVFDLPAPLDWQRIYGATSFTLVVREQFAAVPSGSNVELNVSSDPGRQFVLMTSTNVVQPFNQWTPILTNTLDASGYFSVTNAVNLEIPRQFFILKFP